MGAYYSVKSPEAKSTGPLDPLDGHVVHLHMYYVFLFGLSVYSYHISPPAITLALHFHSLYGQHG